MACLACPLGSDKGDGHHQQTDRPFTHVASGGFSWLGLWLSQVVLGHRLQVATWSLIQCSQFSAHSLPPCPVVPAAGPSAKGRGVPATGA